MIKINREFYNYRENCQLMKKISKNYINFSRNYQPTKELNNNYRQDFRQAREKDKDYRI